MNGIAWNKISFSGCSYGTCYRYFRELQRRGKLKLIFQILVGEKTDIKGLPVNVSFGKGGDDDRDFVPVHLQNGGRRRKIKTLNLDKGYTSCDLIRDLRRRGTSVNMQTKKGDYIRKIGPKFGFKEEKYKVRFLVEKVFTWMENFRHIKLRREYKPAMFKAFVYLSLMLILLRN
ncbi:hypothetical protein A2627_03200 [Candidatus Woesebacteria bacterium RIFCSPHIGHO2_01_FULL_39_28]|uniref:Transposase IS4-like domain-containing protein n=1 Tax=Candidatus Woesebacteria bacterium RIFCSPHIGHO2_01_FULL_39_28 TaxID=1802496 RepID=A0A1F7YC95_9BACT|nr:MAG: hypothetical protein A2627_03200 [Candidatus Woesebacteria bacterium RIFCSPHIGHO2_01_FULL_39_28]